MTPLRTLIAGAGVAGSSLAFWLSKQGHHATVVERHPALRATGLQIDLRSHGVQVLRLMGLEAAYQAKRCPETGLQFVDSSGRRRAYFPVSGNSGGGSQGFTTDWEIMRGDLAQLLYEAARKQGAEFVFGQSVVRFEEVNGKVKVQFENGSGGEFDLMVGADGQWSRTRRMMFKLPPNEDGVGDGAFHSLGGLYVAYFTVPRPVQDGEEYMATLFVAPGRRGMMTRRHTAERIQVYLGGRTQSERMRSVHALRGDGVQEQKEAVAELMRGTGYPLVDEILDTLLADENSDFYLEQLGMVKLDSWSTVNKLVTLLGDAAWAPSANTGMGTTSAIVGAYVLAGEIARHCQGRDGSAGSGVAAALDAYEKAFRPFVDQVQKGVDNDSANIWMPGSAFGISIMHHLLGWASFFRLDVFAKYIMKEKVQDWKLPVYEEMLRD
ncbi:Zeaxanthin epoxidase, chloroplastic [Madurella mycetomatis]|uniref:Zeaxanthin epoxidase, chloroplastic n=1 Tax=Madurella mycetomatis TaxID=100816 RepID=A0A175VUI9_9PEZI|nr:Zeaxanthin epoxidase, chloroplastic [Madurella mycetomatis]